MVDDEEENWGFEGMITVEELASTFFRGKLQEVKRVCEVGGKVVSMTIVEVVYLACERIEVKYKNAELSKRKTDMETELLEAELMKARVVVD